MTSRMIDREIDWAIKHRLVERYRARDGLDLANPRIAQLDLAYHDIRRGRGLFDLLQRKGLVDRVTDDGEIELAKDTPPQSTRAKLRGDFIAAAQAAGRDFTVDWVHLKLNDQAQRTVLCKDPFRSVDERVDRLIASLVGSGSRLRRASAPGSRPACPAPTAELTVSSLRPGSMPMRAQQRRRGHGRVTGSRRAPGAARGRRGGGRRG